MSLIFVIPAKAGSQECWEKRDGSHVAADAALTLDSRLRGNDAFENSDAA